MPKIRLYSEWAEDNTTNPTARSEDRKSGSGIKEYMIDKSQWGKNADRENHSV